MNETKADTFGEGSRLVALTHTAFEGMSGAGRFSADLSRGIYAAMAKPS